MTSSRSVVQLDASVLAILALCSFVAGLIDAIAGGGGLIMLPALFAAGLPPHVALATNKGVAVWGSSTALAVYWRRGAVDVSRARLTLPLGFLGSLAGAMLVLLVPSDVLKPLVVVLLPFAAVAVFVKKPEHGRHPRSAKSAMFRAALVALVIGAYDGFFGPGTGTFLIVGFVLLLDDTVLGATANGKVVNFASNLAAVALFASKGLILWSVALPLAIAQLLGGFVGAHLAMFGGAKFVRAAVVCVVLCLTVKLGWDLFPA